MGQERGPENSQNQNMKEEQMPDSIQELEDALVEKELEQTDAEDGDAVAVTVGGAEESDEETSAVTSDKAAEPDEEPAVSVKPGKASGMNAEAGNRVASLFDNDVAADGTMEFVDDAATDKTMGSVKHADTDEIMGDADEADADESVEVADEADDILDSNSDSESEFGKTVNTEMQQNSKRLNNFTKSAKEGESARKGLARLSATQLTLLLVVEGLLAVLLIVYVCIGIYFTGHFFFHTTLNGMNVSQMSAEEVLQMEEEEIASYELTIECRDGSTYTISAEDFSLQELWNDAIANLVKQQNAFAWVTSLTKDTEYTLEGTIVYDADELAAALSELDFMKAENQVAAVDASISEYNELTGYTIIPSEEGTQINEDVLYEVLDTAFLALNDTVNLVESGCYVEPNITEDDETLNATVASLNSYVATTINYEIGDLTQVLDGNTIKDWLQVADDGTVSLDKTAVSSFVSDLSSTYNTCYSNKTLATSYGETVTITNIHYGWKVDEDAEYAQLLEELEAGETVTRDLNYSMTANSHTGNDYGNSYVEINLTAQHVFVYKDGQLVIDTDCVSGLSSSSDRITPTGAFTLTYKQQDATLTGANYASHVDYWMPFYGNYGMHDASWRSSFGGTIYKTNGSHGCVNLPVSAAKTIYETIDKGWPVLIYNLAGTENNKTVKEAAEKVVDLIDAISDTVTLNDEAAITKAREAYDDLSSSAKEYVTNYDTLKAAESALELLQAEAAAVSEAEAVASEAAAAESEAAESEADDANE